MESEMANIYQSAYMLTVQGYQLVNRSTLVDNLKRVMPDGGTAFRDAASMGMLLILNLATQLINNGVGQEYHFVHVLMTDGEDTDSKTTFDQLKNVNYDIGRLIPSQMLKTYYIGVGLNSRSNSTRELISLAEIGDNSQFLQCSSENISQIFSQIQIELGINQSRFIGAANLSGPNPILFGGVQNQLYINLKENLDISGSMNEHNQWHQVTRSVQSFIKHLSQNIPKSFVNGYLFNEVIVSHHDYQVRKGNNTQRNNLPRFLPAIHQQQQQTYNNTTMNNQSTNFCHIPPTNYYSTPVYEHLTTQNNTLPAFNTSQTSNAHRAYSSNRVQDVAQPINEEEQQGKPFLGFFGGVFLGLVLVAIYFWFYQPHNKNTRKWIFIGTVIWIIYIILLINSS